MSYLTNYSNQALNINTQHLSFQWASMISQHLENSQLLNWYHHWNFAVFTIFSIMNLISKKVLLVRISKVSRFMNTVNQVFCVYCVYVQSQFNDKCIILKISSTVFSVSTFYLTNKPISSSLLVIILQVTFSHAKTVVVFKATRKQKL